MAKIDTLFLLIKSLTKSEKRYFKLAAGRQGNRQNYLELFEILDQLDAYDESRINSKISGRSFMQQLHVVKNYLSQLILKSLRSYHLNHSVPAQIRATLTDVEILFKRDLFTNCIKSLKKAERLAYRIDDQRALLEVIQWKRRVLLNMQGAAESQSLLEAIVEKEREILNNLTNENRYWEMAIGVNGSPGPDALSQHPLLENNRMAKTHRARILYFHLRYIRDTVSGFPDLAEASIDQLVEYLEENPHRLKQDPGSYVSALNNKIGHYLNQRRHAEVPAILQKIRNVPGKLHHGSSRAFSMKLLVRTYNVELETYRDSGQFDQGVAMIPQVRKFLHSNEGRIPEDYRILLHYQFAYLYFMVAELKAALKDINVVLGHRYNSKRADVVGYAQFLNLIIHYELGNTTVMKYAVNASRRFLQKRGKLLEFERILLKLFSRLSTQPIALHVELFIQAHNRLFDDPQLIDESQLDYLDFKHWLASKIKHSKYQS